MRGRPDSSVSDRVWARLRADHPSGGEPAADVGVRRRAPGVAIADAVGTAEVHAQDSTGPARARVRVEVPGRLRGASWLPSMRAAVGVALVIAGIVAVLGVRLAWASVHDTTTPVRAPGSSPGVDLDPAARGSPSTAAAAGSPSSAGPGTASAGATGIVVVDVVGQVGRPGLVSLPAGSRVADAITAAGGATPEADVSLLNQARLVIDGEQIRVPRPDEVIAAAPGAAGPGAAGGAGGGVGALVSLNSADLATLDGLPGVGPVLAQRILDWRSEHGRFTSVDELGEVSGIGDKLMSQLRPRVTL
ncbi:putative DNA-binding protein [Phycicoccus elongatus Lp2]|uniref:Putative DNA-binding protein n=2 Tax=Phycicoccus elongatus TaxID=101689 RepID=N0E5M6_9MICO|nr:putative DNA-binding protein [Phycicoccus elongatus Lp2]